jgi:hypothetical protein
LVAALGVLLASGCATELSLRAASYAPRRARIVFMPAMVALYNVPAHRDVVGR